MEGEREAKEVYCGEVRASAAQLRARLEQQRQELAYMTEEAAKVGGIPCGAFAAVPRRCGAGLGECARRRLLPGRSLAQARPLPSPHQTLQPPLSPCPPQICSREEGAAARAEAEARLRAKKDLSDGQIAMLLTADVRFLFALLVCCVALCHGLEAAGWRCRFPPPRSHRPGATPHCQHPPPASSVALPWNNACSPTCPAQLLDKKIRQLEKKIGEHERAAGGSLDELQVGAGVCDGGLLCGGHEG